jgi:hypothetical protein
MLKVVRARTSTVAAALLVSLCSLHLPHAPDDDHDAHGALAVFAHDASTHALSRTAADAGAAHCVVCHFGRSVRPRADAASLPAPTESAGAHSNLELLTAARPALVTHPPLRAPPASPELART